MRTLGVSLSYANSSYANSSYANSSYANSSYANSSYANSSYANFLYIDLTYTLVSLRTLRCFFLCLLREFSTLDIFTRPGA
jgi:uncharacterized protein YjbI with pentapeptide repeats